ncbi:ABC transporter substrate-binding protein [Tessaracoccus sp.]
MKIKRMLATALVVTMLGATACGGGDQKAGDTTAAQQLVLGNNGDLLSWDPGEMKEGAVIHYAEAIYDPLLRKTADSSIEGNLASEFEYNDDLTELTLMLRDDVTFSDGEKFDGEAVKVNLEARKAGAGSASEAAKVIESIEVTDPSTVKLVLSEPSPGLLSGLATYLGFMVSPKSISGGDIEVNPVGSGPYVLESSDSGVEYTFTAREDYWNREAFPFDSVVIRPYEEFTARYNALTTGQIQFMYGTSDMVPQAETDGLTVQSVPGEWQGIILQDRGGEALEALGDVRVRQAINYALDREAILKAHYSGRGQVTTQTFNPASEAWVEELNSRYPYDPAKAKGLLAEAGYPDGFTLITSYSEGFMSPLVPIVQQYLSDVGISMELVPVNGFASGGLETLKSQPSFMLSFSTNIPAWTDVLNKLTTTSLWNYFGYTDDTVTRLMKEIPLSQGEEQATLYQELNTHLVEDAWFAPIVLQENIYISSPDIKVTMQQAQLVPSLRFFAPAS